MRLLGLAVLWLALGARIALAIIDREPIHDSHLTLACAAFFLVSAVLGGRIMARRHDEPVNDRSR